MPHLSRDAGPPRSLHLGSENLLRRQDLTQLFDYLNQNQNLSSLKHFFETFEPKDWDHFRILFNRHFIESSATKRGGFAQLLSQRWEKKFFSLKLEEVKKWDETIYPSLSLLRKISQYEGLGEVLRRDRFLLAPSIAQAIDAQRDLPARKFVFLQEQQDTRPSPEMVLSDLTRFLGDPKSIQASIDFASSFNYGSLLPPFMEALKVLDGEQKGRSAEAAAAGMSHLSKTFLPDALEDPHHYLDLLVSFFAATNSSSHELFYILQERLRNEPAYLDQLLRQVEPISVLALEEMIFDRFASLRVSQILRLGEKNRDDAASFEFLYVYRKIEDAIEHLLGPIDTYSSLGRESEFLAGLSRKLHAYVLTRRVEQIALENKALFESLKQSDSAQVLWEEPVTLGPFSLSLFEKRAQEDFKFLSSMGVVEESFYTKLEQLKDSGVGGKFDYAFEEQQSPFSSVLKGSIKRCDSVRPLASSQMVWRLLFLQVTRPGGSLTSLSQLDSPNLFVSLNRMVTATSLEFLKKLKKIVFTDLGLGKLSVSAKEFLVNFFESSPKAQALVSDMLTHIPGLEKVDESFSPQLPSLLEIYHEWVQHIPAAHLPILAKGFSLAKTTGLFSLKPDPQEFLIFHIEYPGTYQFLVHGGMLARSLDVTQGIYEQAKEELDRALQEALIEPSGDKIGLEDHYGLLHWILADQREGLLDWTRQFLDEGLFLFPTLGAFKAEERQWVMEVLGSKELGALFAHFQTHWSVDRLEALLEELLGLLDRGEMREVALLLGYLERPGFKNLSEVLMEGCDSGELRAFLESLQQALGHLKKAPLGSGAPQLETIELDMVEVESGEDESP